MTPEQLKASILQYAIQGKLVEQRPEEGTGEELYRQIQAEKQRLIKEGKLKKEKPLTEITEDEIPFEIPENWMWVRWGDLSFSIQYGYNAPAKNTGRIKMVRISDIQNGEVVWETVPFCDIEEDEIPTYLLATNDILFARTGGTVGKSYIVKETPADAIYAGYLIRTRYSDTLCPEYLYYFMQTQLYWTQLRNGTIATAQPNCNGQTLSKMILPLPSLTEQKRIVAKIEELLPYVDRYAAAYEKLEQFNDKFPEDMKKSILQYAIQGKLVEQRAEEGTGADLYKQMQAEKQRLTKEKKIKKEKPLAEITDDEIPFDIPETWIWIRVGDVGSWGSGATPPRTNPAYYGGSIPWLKTGDLNDGFIKEVPEFITELALEKTSVRLNPVGSVLMAMYGATIGKLGILEIPVTTNQACCACIPYAGMYNKYLFYYLMSMRQTYIGMAEGGAQPNISKEKIVNSILPLPPLEEQHRIVAKLEEILPLCERLK